MFFRILNQSFSRQRRRKSLAALAVISGMAAATAMLTVRVNLGDDLNAELRTIGANLVVTPAADSLPVTLNGVDLRPAGRGALLSERDLPRIKTIFWTNNIVAFAPVLDTRVRVNGQTVVVEGTWFDHPVPIPGSNQVIHTGMRQLARAWRIDGAWPEDGTNQVLVGARLAAALGLHLGGVWAALPAGASPTGAGFRGGGLEMPGAEQASTAGRRSPATERPAGATQTKSGRATFIVAGILTSGAAEDDEIVAPLHWAQALAGVPGKLRRILVSAITKPEDAFARGNPAHMTPAEAERWMCSPYALTIAAQLRQAIPGAAAAVVRPVAESEGVILGQLRLLIWFITLLALFASALAISGAMTAAVMERRDEIALMKALGARDTSIGALFLSEAALLGLGGGVVGYLLGEGLANAIAHQVLGHAIAWKPALAPLILLLGGLVALLGSLRPLRRALRIEPAVVLRGEA